MSEEFNIFKNLDDLKKTNLLEQLKSLESAETTGQNDSHCLDNDDFDFDSLLNNNSPKRIPTKRQRYKEKTASPEKKSKKNGKSRRSSTSTNGSISPTMPLLENLSKTVPEMPISRRTRRSLGACKKVAETGTILENMETSASNGRGRGKGRGRNRGVGRGRARSNASISTSSSYDLHNDSTDVILSSSNDLSVHDEESLDQVNSTLSITERFLQQCRRGRSRVMRARRQYIAEIAARSTQVDYVDLVTSPMPRVEGFIELDSDTEQPSRTTRRKKKNQDTVKSQKNKKASATNASLDISFEEDNPELNIKVNWKSKPETFKLRKHQKFSVIFEQLAKRENVSVENIVFNLEDRIIMAEDTPDSINYKNFHFIDGRVLSLRHFNSPRAVPAARRKRDANKVSLKIQSDKWKRPLQLDIMKTDKFRILYIKCAEELKVGLDQLKLSFDGELLKLNDAPTDLDLEGGEAIDLHIKN